MVCEIDDVLIAFEVGFTGPNILDVGNLFGPLNSSKAAFRMRTDHLAAPHCKLRWRIVKRNATEGERSSSRSGGKEHHRGDSPIHPGLASAPASRTGSIWGMV